LQNLNRLEKEAKLLAQHVDTVSSYPEKYLPLVLEAASKIHAIINSQEFIGRLGALNYLNILEFSICNREHAIKT